MSWYSDGEYDLYDRDPPYCENCNRGFNKAECDACAERHYEMECRYEGQRCETCYFYKWDAVKEIFYCDNTESEWHGEELEDEGWCKQWQAE
jgi:hypothetical protein